MAEDTDKGPGEWKSLLDPRIEYTNDVLLEKIRSAWSWDRFYITWNWFRYYVDGEASKNLAKYYCERTYYIPL